jgi:hypothetical protein
METITRDQAKEQGLARYYTGQPCAHGHISERIVSNYTCIECARAKDRERGKTESRLESKRASYHRNGEVNRKRDRARNKNPERLERSRKWKEENRERHNAASVAYKLERLKVDPVFRMTMNLRKRLVNAVDAQGARKHGTTNTLTGCNTFELRAWLEEQFTDGMTWDNYGVKGWHVDHIRPCASFDLTDPEQQKECFHYTNLQPLWAEENRRKSDSLDWEREASV